MLCVTYPFTKYVSCSSTSIDTISTSLVSISIEVIGTSTNEPLSDLSNLSSYQSVNPLMGDIAQGLTPTQTEGDKVISIKRPATK